MVRFMVRQGIKKLWLSVFEYVYRRLVKSAKHSIFNLAYFTVLHILMFPHKTLFKSSSQKKHKKQALGMLSFTSKSLFLYLLI